MHPTFISLAFCCALALAAPQQANDSEPLNPARVTSFPVCGTPGFTETPGDNYLEVFPPPPVSLFDCVRSCRRNSTCKAVSYAEEYELCTFYGKYMKFDQLNADDTSNFGHWDEVCRVERGEEDGNGHGDGGYKN